MCNILIDTENDISVNFAIYNAVISQDSEFTIEQIISKIALDCIDKIYIKQLFAIWVSSGILERRLNKYINCI